MGEQGDHNCPHQTENNFLKVGPHMDEHFTKSKFIAVPRVQETALLVLQD